MSTSESTLATTWSSRHVYLHADHHDTDMFLTQCLGPAMQELEADGRIEQWFYLRYWTGGPHVRVRFRTSDADADADAFDGVEHRIQEWLAAHSVGTSIDPTDFYGARDGVAVHGWFEHGTVVPATYVPETDRYGGADLMPHAERFFAQSTTTTIAALADCPTESRRATVALGLLLVFARSVCDSPAEEISLFRRYVYSSRFNTVDAPSVDTHELRMAAERVVHSQRAALHRVAAQVDAASMHESGGGYLGLLSRSAAAYRASVDATPLGGFRSRWSVLLSQLHMTMNRLGVSIAEEYRLCWIASLVRSGALADDFHGSGVHPAARHSHEAGKYFLSALDEQRPRPVSPPTDGRSEWEPAPVVLDPPQPVPGALDALLHTRRSRVPRSNGDVSRQALSTLLHAAAGSLRIDAPDGSVISATTYPTSGGKRCTRLFVLPQQVPSVESAVYEYDADEHSLRLRAPAPPARQLAAASPYFADAVNTARIPLWLFVIGDLTRLSRTYGARAYRFMLLESGHLAQNVLLAATALGYDASPVGGFYDDAVGQLLELDGVESVPVYVIPIGPAPTKGDAL